MNAEKLAWGPGLPAVLPWVDASPLWVPRLCLTWVSRSRVHITEATLKHLDKAYEVEDGHGQQRDPYLKEMNIRTYLVIDPRVRGLGGRSWGGTRRGWRGPGKPGLHLGGDPHGGRGGEGSCLGRSELPVPRHVLGTE